MLIYEKLMRKRSFAKSLQQKQKLRRQKMLPLRYEEELTMKRDILMRRMSGYFLNLFDLKIIAPFYPFVSPDTLEDFKEKAKLV